jgi:hypothetical protein
MPAQEENAMSAWDENSLYGLRRTPPEDFTRKLRASLQQESVRSVAAPRRMGKVAVIAAACLATAGAFAVPAVRAGAMAFLDMFRVVHFAAVPVDSGSLQRSLQQLRGSDLDVRHLLADQVQVLQKPGAPTAYATPAEAGAAAGIRVYLPSWMPVGWNMEAPEVQVQGGSAARVTANTARLAQILAALDIDDVTIPAGLDGQSATIRISPAVAMRWQHDGQTVQLLQSSSPQADFPAGTDLQALAEIGLRIMGLSSSDAYRFAQSIDWRTTLLVPIPANAATFRQVSVKGSSGLLVERADMGARRHGAGAVLLWSDGSQVFALSGSVPSVQLLEMAQTLQ